MNKYSSKAIKTAATVGMSLAMVLSNVAPVMAAVTPTTPSAFCVTDKVNAGIEIANAIDSLLANAGYTKENVKTGTTFTKAQQDATSLKDYITTADGKEIDDILGENLTVTGFTTTTVADILAELVSCDPSANEYEVEIAKHFVRKYNGSWTSFDALVADVTTQFSTLNTKMNPVSATPDAADDYRTINSTNYTAANNLNKLLSVLVDYVDNASSTVTGYSDYKAFKKALADYEETLEGSTLKSYIAALEILPVAGGVNVRNLVDREDPLHYRYLTTVENFIKNVKGNKIASLDGIAKYAKVQNADEVANYISGLEDIVAEMKEAKELLSDSNDAKEAYEEVDDKIATLEAAVVARKALSSSATQETINNADDDIQKAMNKFTEADLEAVQTYVEDVINQFVTVKARKLSSGNYSLSFENADYGRYISQTDNRAAEFDSNLTYLMLTTVEKDAEDSYYDLLMDNDASTKDTLIKAATTDVKGITLGTELTSAQAAKIVTAKNALDELDIDTDGANPYGLTSKEKRSVNNNRTLIETLYLKLILNGTVTQSGWVDKGNGDWDYIAEDGSRPTKWIASGANWYYVKNGTMLRNSWIASDAQGTRWYYVDGNGVMVSNTTVNGYTFNSYGVWVK